MTIHVDDSITPNWACTEQLQISLKKAQYWAVMRMCSFSAGRTFALITNILHIYLLFYIWSWYIYEIKIHATSLKQNYCWSQTHSIENWEESNSFTWRSMEGDCNVYALFAVNAPIMRMIFIDPDNPDRYSTFKKSCVCLHHCVELRVLR